LKKLFNVDNPFKSPVVISFCPGILGIERGLARAGVECHVITYVEIEAFIIANLVAGMEAGILGPAPIWTNAKTFDSRPFRGRIHGIIGGYPCPGESLAGLREGHLYKGFIWPAIRRAVATTRPLWCFFENVDDHLTGTYPIVQRSLRNMGYRVEAGIFSAEEVGAPQERKRLFILAVANTNSYGYGAGTGKVTGTSGEIESKTQRQEWDELLRQWMWDVIGDGGEELGNSNCSQRGQSHPSRNQRNRYNAGWEKEASGFELAGQESLADFVGQRLEGFGIRTGITESKITLPAGSSNNQWPARRGEQQYEWEEPRTIESPLGRYAHGNPDGIDILHVNGIYEIYTTKKIGTIKALSVLWATIEQKTHEWTIGGLFNFLEKEILFSKLYGDIQNQRLAFTISRCEDLSKSKENSMREMWIKEPIGYSPQGQEYLKQLEKEFADTMCILSYQIALAGRQEAQDGSRDETLQRLWHDYQDAWWDVPETLSAIQEVWRPFSNQTSWRRQIEAAYKGYRLELFGSLYGYNFREDLLRALGNSVVEQTAELAFKTLLQKHLKIIDPEPIPEDPDLYIGGFDY
jgi:site-specific DNA-cytosine methylase